MLQLVQLPGKTAEYSTLFLLAVIRHGSIYVANKTGS